MSRSSLMTPLTTGCSCRRRSLKGKRLSTFFHPVEHLERAVPAAHGESSVQTRRKVAELRIALREDHGIEKVIQALGYLQKKFPRWSHIATELIYFRKHRRRVRYAQLATDGLSIGFGVVEAACKSLVAQRLKVSGMRWSQKVGQVVLTARAVDQSGRFDKAWVRVAATYHVEVCMLHNVHPLPPPPSWRQA